MYALNGVTGSVIWRAADIGRIIGSVVTADLTGQGYQDVLVPTINGLFILDGRTGQQVAEIGQGVGLQNAPLVTEDPGGGIGITLAGYSGACGCQGGIGVVEHYTIAGSGAEAVGSGSWPMFHHDPQLTGNAGRHHSGGFCCRLFCAVRRAARVLPGRRRRGSVRIREPAVLWLHGWPKTVRTDRRHGDRSR